MTREEAKANQDRIVSDGFDLGWYYGTDCEKCCGVFPKFSTEYNISGGYCFYECEVCGKRTDAFPMPWQAVKAWNGHEWRAGQTRWF